MYKIVLGSFALTTLLIAQEGGELALWEKKKKVEQAPLGGEPLAEGAQVAGYNAPARIEVARNWDLYGQATFTYWQALQEGMPVGYFHQTGALTEDEFINTDFSYSPGFQILLGMNLPLDHWTTELEYTWFRNTDSNTASSQGNKTLAMFGLTARDYAEYFQDWKLGLDWIDWNVARTYYSGTNWTFSPLFGLKTGWIRQKIETRLEKTGATGEMSNQWHGWGIGPKAGVRADFLLSHGLYFFGSGKGDLLYTRYSDVLQKTIDPNNQSGNVSRPSFWMLKSHVELELGFGWGTYFANRTWHVDLSAGYRFQTFFSQNIFSWVGGSGVSLSGEGNNLYLQGLDLSARFDF